MKKLKENKSYLYISGVATGLIMAILSVFTSFQMMSYVEKGGSFTVLIIGSILLGIVVGALIGYLVNSVSD
jgi:mannose/fructose/N-acetylgalactosamine-specific phosphotransferase system component IID